MDRKRLNCLLLGIPIIMGVASVLLMLDQAEEQHQQQHQHQPRRNNRRPRTPPFRDDSTTCPICFDSMNPEYAFFFKCGHKIHNNCRIEMDRQRVKQCPMCRADIE